MSVSERNLPPFDPEIWNRHALLACEEMRRAEALSVERGPRRFYDLMKEAGKAVAQAIMDRYPKGRVLVLAGTGNNGGDGYVAAQALRDAGWSVRVGALGKPTTPDADRAAWTWRGETVPLAVALLDEADIVIDALFGTGLTRPLEGLAADIVRALGARQIPVACADFPSGIDGDTGRVMGVAVRAQLTVTFFRKKRGHALMPGLERGGEILVAETGMHQDVLDEIAPVTAENDKELWRDLLPKLEADGHKYLRGHALIFGGPVMTGASRLAARSAQRMGAGLVTLAAPKESWEVYAKALESVIVQPVEELAVCQALIDDEKRNAILIGPGLGLEPEKRELVLAVLASRKPCVLDADALTLFAEEPEILFKALHEDCVLTPHEGEFSRLFGSRIDSETDKISRAQEAAKMAGCVVLLKGAETVIASPKGFAVVNLNAPPWLATGGAGDVLAGMILGLIAAGMPAFAAACAAAHFHGAIATAHGPGLIAEDLVDGISSVLKTNEL